MRSETMFHIIQQRPKEGTLNFETFDQAIENISKDINAMAKKARTQKRK
jgi:hypothetical protein